MYYCEDCGAPINEETDRHLVLVERLVAPDLGREGAEGAAYCADCLDPRVASLESIGLR